jgi:hypothetical protein
VNLRRWFVGRIKYKELARAEKVYPVEAQIHACEKTLKEEWPLGPGAKARFS